MTIDDTFKSLFLTPYSLISKKNGLQKFKSTEEHGDT